MRPKGGDKHFENEGRKSLYFGIRGGGDDHDGGDEEDVREANHFVSKASKLSVGAKIFRGL